MLTPGVVWLASYPRSGNTYLRTILWHCFGQRSASIYPKDLGGKKELESYVGHIPEAEDGAIHFPSGNLPLVKTHEKPTDNRPAIYVVRDARPASVSLWEFYGRSLPLEDIILGNHRFGRWSDHLQAWQPWSRPDTLFIKYEDIVQDLAGTLGRISGFLGCPILTDRVPERSAVANVDGRWVRKKSEWSSKMTDAQLRLCNEVNGAMLAQLGYLP